MLNLFLFEGMIVGGVFAMLQISEAPLFCAVIYAMASSWMGFCYGVSGFELLISALIGLIVTYIYFKLLVESKQTPFWWPILIIGLVIMVWF